MKPTADDRPGLLAVCLSIRSLPEGGVESVGCVSVLEGVELGIQRLTDRTDRTAIILVGEDTDPGRPPENLARRGAALCGLIGQPGLFVTLAAQDIVRDRLMSDVRFEDFGVLVSADLDRAERVFAVFHPDLVEPVPPQKSIVGNCPRLHRSFVGRHREVDELQDLILHRSVVTIIGPPGVGKSTTAIHVARCFGDEYDDGVWWFSVDTRTSLDELLQAIASSRALPELHGALSLERVSEALAPKRCVIILDGCEGMAADVATFASLTTGRDSNLTLLITSTRPLGIPNEFVYRLRPMSLPKPGDTGEDALIGSEALSLFYERAVQAGEPLPLDDQTVTLAGKVCELVDGMPVAVELIATSLRTTSLQRLTMELPRDLGELFKRQHGLDAAMRFSYRLLRSDLQSLLSRLALFRGEWKLTSVAKLWPDDFEPRGLADLHQALVEASWISYDPDHDSYRMLHMIRAFCWEQAGSDAEKLTAGFATRVAELASDLVVDLQGQSSIEVEADLTRHYNDIASALELCLEKRNSECASSLMKSLVRIWLRRNMLDDAERLSTAFLHSGVIDMDAARALVMLGVVNLRRRRLDAAEKAFEKCLRIAVRLGHMAAEGSVLINLGMTMMVKGDVEAARKYYGRALRILRERNAPLDLCTTLCNAADVELKVASDPVNTPDARSGALLVAESLLEEAAAFVDSATPHIAQAFCTNKGMLHLLRDELEEAETAHSRAILLCARHGLRHEANEALEGLAQINLARNLSPTAAKLLGLSRQIRQESGKTNTEREAERFGRLVSSLCQAMDAERAAKLMRYGERLDLAEILTPRVFNA